MNAREVLRELGYGSSSAEVARFQRDHNKLDPSSLHVSGQLDEPTLEALELARRSKALFRALRDQKEW